MVALVCERFGCVPSVAARELRENAHLMSVMQAGSYRDAWTACEQWDSAPRDRRGDQPSGRMVDEVRKRQAGDARRMMEARKKALEAEGRV